MPDGRPIPKRPDWLFSIGFSGYDCATWKNLRAYIEYLEMELKLCKASKGPFKKITNMDVQREIDSSNVRR